MSFKDLNKLMSKIASLLFIMLAAQMYVSCSSTEPEDEQLEVSENNEFLNNVELNSENIVAEAPVEQPKVEEAKTEEPKQADMAPMPKQKVTKHKKEYSGSFKYKIIKHDWLSKISQRVYGEIDMWPIIHKANPWIKNPNLIYPNQVVVVPIVNALSQQFAEEYKAKGVAMDERHNKMHRHHKKVKKAAAPAAAPEAAPAAEPAPAAPEHGATHTMEPAPAAAPAPVAQPEQPAQVAQPEMPNQAPVQAAQPEQPAAAPAQPEQPAAAPAQPEQPAAQPVQPEQPAQPGV